MAKIRQNTTRGKSPISGPAATFEDADRFPFIAQVLGSPEKMEMLELTLRGHNLVRISKEVAAAADGLVAKLETVRKLEGIVGQYPAKTLQEYTEERLAEQYPPLAAHFVDLMGNALGYEDLLRQLLLHHNFESLEAGDISDLLYQVEELRSMFRDMARLKENSTPSRLAA